MAESFHLYTTEWGHYLVARTYLSTIGTASSIKFLFKKVGTSTTAELNASVVNGDTTYYAVEANTSSGWMTDKVGTWIGQVQATFTGGVFLSDPFTMVIEAAPTT